MTERTDPKWDDQAMEVAIARLLRFGVTLSAAVVLVGGVLYLSQAHGAEPDYATFHGIAAPLRQTVAGVAQGVRRADGRSVIALGLLLLIATPIARVVFAACGFLRKGDWLYFGVSAAVLAILLYSLLFSR